MKKLFWAYAIAVICIGLCSTVMAGPTIPQAGSQSETQDAVTAKDSSDDSEFFLMDWLYWLLDDVLGLRQRDNGRRYYSSGSGSGTNPGDSGSGSDSGDSGSGSYPGDSGSGSDPGDSGSGSDPGDSGSGSDPGDSGSGSDPGDGDWGTDPGDGDWGTDPGSGDWGTDPGSGDWGTDRR